MTPMLRRTSAALASIVGGANRTRIRPHAAGALAIVAAAQPVTPKVSLENIGLTYATNTGERLTALQHINLHVRAGEFLCIVGPSGCGKSTLLHLIAGLHRQTSGEVLVDNNPVQGTGTDRI